MSFATMAPDDLESQSPDAPLRKLSIMSRFTTGTFLQKTSSNGTQADIPVKLILLPSDEARIFQHLISLLVDNQPMTPALKASCHWYRKYLRNNITAHWLLIRSALNAVKRYSPAPSLGEFAAVVSFVHEIAGQLITKKYIALTDIVDFLVNAKYFKPELDEDEYRAIPNQLVFTAIGWLLLLYEVPLVQQPHRLQIKHTLTTSPSSTGHLNSRNFRERSQGFEYIDMPLFMLLNKFGDLIPEVKPEASWNAITNFLPASESLAVQLICFGTVFHVTQLTIEWVDSLSLHLELDVSRRTLKLFRFPSYCRMMYHNRNPHRQLLTDHATSQLGCEKEPLVPTASFFREMLLTYRVLFGQDERSFRAFQRALPTYNLHWDCSGRNPHRVSDPMLPLLCGKSWTTPEACCLYNDIDAGAVRDFYDSNEDFPILGQRLLTLQQFVKDYHPGNLRALLRDRRNPSAWYSFWTNQTLLFFASLAILLAVLQLIFQIWQVILAREQLAQGYVSLGPATQR